MHPVKEVREAVPGRRVDSEVRAGAQGGAGRWVMCAMTRTTRR